MSGKLNNEVYEEIKTTVADMYEWYEIRTLPINVFELVRKMGIGMIGCKQERIPFMKGYTAMMDSIEPRGVICFGNPFPEMEGNLIVIDYISSRRVVRNGR